MASNEEAIEIKTSVDVFACRPSCSSCLINRKTAMNSLIVSSGAGRRARTHDQCFLQDAWEWGNPIERSVPRWRQHPRRILGQMLVRGNSLPCVCPRKVVPTVAHWFLRFFLLMNPMPMCNHFHVKLCWPCIHLKCMIRLVFDECSTCALQPLSMHCWKAITGCSQTSYTADEIIVFFLGCSIR